MRSKKRSTGDELARDVPPALEALERIGTIAREALNASAPQDGLDGLYRRAKALHAERRCRDRAFEGCSDLFLEPAWDILLDLFVAEHEDRAVTVDVACLAARVSRSTSIRYLTLLEKRGLIEGVFGSTSDLQVVKLTQRAYERMQTALEPSKE